MTNPKHRLLGCCGPLGPLLVWIKWKMATNFAMIVLVVLYTLIFLPWENDFSREVTDALGEAFAPEWADPADTLTYLYTYEDTTMFMKDTFEAWDDLIRDDLSMWHDRTPLIMTLNYVDSEDSYKQLAHTFTDIELTRGEVVCALSEDNPLGPFGHYADSMPLNKSDDDCSPITDVQWRADTVTVEFSVKNTEAGHDVGQDLCHQWDVTQRFEFARTGVIQFTLNVGESLCNEDLAQKKSGLRELDWFLIVVGLLAVFSAFIKVVSVKTVFEFKKAKKRREQQEALAGIKSSRGLRLGASFADYHHAHNNNNDNQLEFQLDAETISSYSTKSTQSTTSSARREEFFADMLGEVDTTVGIGGNLTEGYSWVLAGLVGDVLCFVWVVMKWTLRHSGHTGAALVATRLCLGMGAFLQSVSFVAHLGDQPWFYLLIHSLQYGVPAASRHACGCLPLYFGYACVGTYCFGPYCAKFQNLDISCVSLFAVMNGDVVHDTFAAIYPENSAFLKFFSRFFLYTFIVMFIYVALNVFLAIMEDTYWQIKQSLVLDLQDDLRDEQEAAKDFIPQNVQTHI